MILKKTVLISTILILILGMSATMLKPVKATGFQSPSNAEILQGEVQDNTGFAGVGTYTIGTFWAYTPAPNDDVLYGGHVGQTGTTFTSIQVTDTQTEYVTSSNSKNGDPGYTVKNLDDYSYVTASGPTWETVSWTTDENLLVTLYINIQGTTIADSLVQITVTVQNNDPYNDHSVGIRQLWDVAIGYITDTGYDCPYIRPWTDPMTPQSWTHFETEWDSPTFQFWEITNPQKPPSYSMYGSVSSSWPLGVSTPTTPPDKLMYVNWYGVQGTAYGYTPTIGQDLTTTYPEGDSAVVYYWNPATISKGGSQISRTAYIGTFGPSSLPNFVVPEVPWGTIIAATAMIAALGSYLLVPRFRRPKQLSS
ncbi:MAG: hypothetical protein ABSD73_05825 [Candidatus Bathyarchaeia archaeon]